MMLGGRQSQRSAQGTRSNMLATHLFERTERTTLAKLEREEKRKALNDLQEKKLAKHE